MQAMEAIKFLEMVLKAADIEDFKFRLLAYNSALPAYVNCEEIPPAPEVPEWLLDEE